MTIRVTLSHPKRRTFILAQWEDPVTGKTKTSSTKTRVRRDAERFAARLEDELNAGDYKPPVKTTWGEFRERYETEVGAGKALKTRLKTQSMFNAVERLIQPKMVGALTANVISKHSAALRAEGLSEFTIKGHLAELRKTLNWAAKLGMIHSAPHIEFPRTPEPMKGRPITAEEFDRYLVAIAKCEAVRPEFVSEWKRFAEGLWLSGLRLEEAMRLHWTDDRQLCIDFSHRRPMMRIQAKAEKGRSFRLLPITPDFAEFLERTPAAARSGFVFNPWTPPQGRSKRLQRHRPTHEHAGRVLSEIGETAGIKVNEEKYASAHDLRRAFGYRWAKLVMPKVLQELMRHASIQTTMAFYVGSMAEDSADEVWKAAARAGNTFGNTTPEHAETPAPPQEKHTVD